MYRNTTASDCLPADLVTELSGDRADLVTELSGDRADW